MRSVTCFVGSLAALSLLGCSCASVGYASDGDDEDLELLYEVLEVVEEGEPEWMDDDEVDGDDDPCDDDDSARVARATAIEEQALREVIFSKGHDARAQVQIQEAVINEGVEDVDELNEDLARLIEELREQRGLPEEDVFVSPLEEHANQMMQQQAPIELHERVLAGHPDPPVEEKKDD